MVDRVAQFQKSALLYHQSSRAIHNSTYSQVLGLWDAMQTQ